MNFDLLRAVRDLPLPPPVPPNEVELTMADKLVLVLLAMRADSAASYCWTSYPTIARNGWMSVRTAKVAVARLVAAGLVELCVRREDGTHERAANGYRVLVRPTRDVVQPLHDLVQEPHDVVQPSHDEVVQPLHGGRAVAAPEVSPEASLQEVERAALPQLRIVEGGKTSRRKPETPVPASDASPSEVEAWCRRWGIPSPTANLEAEAMLDHARTHDRRCRDWGAAWKTWMRRAPQFAPTKARPVQQAPAGGSTWE